MKVFTSLVWFLVGLFKEEYQVFHCFWYASTKFFLFCLRMLWKFYTFCPSWLQRHQRWYKNGSVLLDSWCAAWAMTFSALKSRMVAYKCHILTGTFEICHEVIPFFHTIRDLGLHFSSTFNFSERTLIQVAKARRPLVLVHRTFRNRESRLLICRTPKTYPELLFHTVFQHAKQ